MSVEKPPYNFTKSAAHFSTKEIENFYKQLFALFNSIYPLSRALRRSIIKHTRVEVFKKDAMILEIGKINKRINFVVSGLLMAYYVKDNADKRVSWFLKEGAMAISVVSYELQVPSYEAIMALEDTICISMSHDDHEWHYEKFLAFNVYGRKLKIPFHIIDNQRVYSSIMENATQRYKRLLATLPDIFQRVKLEYIASYLGITQQSLSRIRNRLKGEK